MYYTIIMDQFLLKKFNVYSTMMDSILIYWFIYNVVVYLYINILIKNVLIVI